MEIQLDTLAVSQIRLSAADAIDEGDTETLREDIIEAFTDDQIEEIERRIDAADFYDFMTELLEEWGGEGVDDFFELLEGTLADAGVELKYHNPELSDSKDDDEDEEREQGMYVRSEDEDEEDED